MSEIKQENNAWVSQDKLHKTSRPKTRRFLFQYLYAIAHWQSSRDDFMASFYKESFLDQIDWVYFREVCKWIIEKESLILVVISKYAPKFRIEKMQVEQIIPMLISIFEMLYYSEELPYKISINEAVELSKIYCDDSNRKLVNWVLNNVAQNHKEILKELEEKEISKENIFFKVDLNNI